jgi:anti-sigma factor ChrR (cupin superfamily)
MLDRVGNETARATGIVRHAPGSHLDRHVHDAGEEILVLDGIFSNEGGDYEEGTWLRSPRWSRHTPFTGPEAALI